MAEGLSLQNEELRVRWLKVGWDILSRSRA
jgi:hypothetical protein